VSAAAPPVESGSRTSDVRRLLAERPEIALGIVLIGLILVTHFASETGFLTARQLSNTVQIAAPLGIIAAGQTLVMLTAGIDLSVASTATAAAYVMASQEARGTAFAIVCGLAVGLVVGLFNGIGVGVFRVNPLIMTLGTATIIVGAITIFSQSRYATKVSDVPPFVKQVGGGRLLEYLPKSLLLWAPLAIAIILALRYSGLGRMLYAVGDNPRACRLAGVRVWQVQVAVYALCGMLAALAGIVLAGFTSNVDLALGSSYLLPSVAAVVIGGTSIFGGVGGYSGTIFGALILTVLSALLTLLDAPQELKTIVYGSIILLLAWAYAALSRST
jgi:ribose transport system permease protein